MLLVTIAAITLLALAVNNAYEFLLVYKVHRGKANMVDAHSRVREAMELFGFIFAGILAYLSELDTLAVIVIIAGPWQLFHLVGALSSEQSLLRFSQKTLGRLVKALMAVTFTEVVVAVFTVAWMASNGWIAL